MKLTIGKILLVLAMITQVSGCIVEERGGYRGHDHHGGYEHGGEHRDRDRDRDDDRGEHHY